MQYDSTNVTVVRRTDHFETQLPFLPQLRLIYTLAASGGGHN